jgi:hypothetical protein
MKRRSRGDDAIYYDSNKRRYFGAVSLGYGPDGKRIRRKVSGGTRTQVKDRLNELHAEIDAGIRTDVNCTVAMCLNDWVSQEHNSKSPKTRRVYESLAKSIVTDPGQDRDPLRDWGRTARLCAIYLAQGVPPVLLLWLTGRR